MTSSPPNIMPILAQGYISSRQASPAASLCRSRTNSAAITPSSTSRTPRRDRGREDAEKSPSRMEGTSSVYSVTDTQLAERYEVRPGLFTRIGVVFLLRAKQAMLRRVHFGSEVSSRSWIWKLGKLLLCT